jgi:hypothetical protein
MIRQVNQVRDRVIREVGEMLGRVHLWVGLLPETEVDVLNGLQGDSRETLQAEISNLLLKRFGQEPSESRFSRANRALRKGMPRGARKQTPVEAT